MELNSPAAALVAADALKSKVKDDGAAARCGDAKCDGVGVANCGAGQGSTPGGKPQERYMVVTRTRPADQIPVMAERFHASILPGTTGADKLAIEPTCGPLAPRGGANNVCDPNKPYTDYADIKVIREGVKAGAEAATLLVRTEEEQWLFRLV